MVYEDRHNPAQPQILESLTQRVTCVNASQMEPCQKVVLHHR